MSRIKPIPAGAAEEVVPDCPHCGKPLPLCICDSVTPIKSKVSLLILQHPQEQDRALGTARLDGHAFQGCGPQESACPGQSLSKALGRKVDDPSRWAVLYLGSAKVADLDTDAEIVAINRKGEVEPHQRAILSDIEGIVLLDGTLEPGQGAVVAQRVDAEVPAGHSWARSGLRATASSARSRAATALLHHRGRRPAAGRARKAAGDRRNAQRLL